MGVRTAEEMAEYEEFLALESLLAGLPPELAASIKEQASQAGGL
jgi:hypothetical protein